MALSHFVLMLYPYRVCFGVSKAMIPYLAFKLLIITLEVNGCCEAEPLLLLLLLKGNCDIDKLLWFATHFWFRLDIISCGSCGCGSSLIYLLQYNKEPLLGAIHSAIFWYFMVLLFCSMPQKYKNI